MQESLLSLLFLYAWGIFSPGKATLEKQGTAIPDCQGLCFSLHGHGRGREGDPGFSFAPRVISACGFTQKMTQERNLPPALVVSKQLPQNFLVGQYLSMGSWLF